MKKVIAIAIGIVTIAAIATGSVNDERKMDLLAQNDVQLAEVAEPQMIFDIDFNDESVTPNIGAATQGSNSGTYGESYDGTFAYQFNSSYFKPTTADGEPLLTGLEEFTVSYWANMGTNQGWTLFAAPNTDTQTYPYEKYIGILDNNINMMSERYNNNGSRPTNIYLDNIESGWKHVVLVVSAEQSELYINGESVSVVASDYSVSSILGDASIIQVGKACWGSGEYASGLIDNYHIYNYALTSDEVVTLYNDEHIAPIPKVSWETDVDSIKTGKGDSATGTLRFLAAVSDDCGYDISKGEYGFVFVNFEPDTVANDYMGNTEIPAFTGEVDENTKTTVSPVGESGLLENTTFYIDITDIPLSTSKMGVYAVPYVTLEDGTVIYGTPFTAEEFKWVNEQEG